MSFAVGLSGLKAADSELRVTGHNIANVGTTGFKRSRAHFGDVYAASALGGAGSTTIGSGTQLLAVQQQHTQGNSTATNNPLNMMVNGNGFFILQKSDGSTVYSRDGNFSTDESNQIVNAGGQMLTGFLADSNGNITGSQGVLTLDNSDFPPEDTTSATIQVNLDATQSTPAASWTASTAPSDPPPDPTAYTHTTATTIYDSLGNAHVMSIYFIKTNTANEWDVRVRIDNIDVDSNPTGTPFSQVFDSDGSFDTASSDSITIEWDPKDSAGNDNGADVNQEIDIAFTGSTQFGSDFAVQSLTQDGFSSGKLTGVSTSSTGVIFAQFSNGQSQALGQVALASFDSNEGLQPAGGNLFTETFDSGAARIGTAGTSDLGSIQSGTIEDSNVELTEEFIKLLTAQRNFQANAKTIEANNTTTQALIQAI